MSIFPLLPLLDVRKGFWRAFYYLFAKDYIYEMGLSLIFLERMFRSLRKGNKFLLLILLVRVWNRKAKQNRSTVVPCKEHPALNLQKENLQPTKPRDYFEENFHVY